MTTALRTETVTRLRPSAGSDDRYGDDTTETPGELPITGALFAPGGTQEPVQIGRAPVIAEPSLYFPRAWPDITATDKIRVRSGVYQVTGFPGDWRGVTAGGLVVELKRVTG